MLCHNDCHPGVYTGVCRDHLVLYEHPPICTLAPFQALARKRTQFRCLRVLMPSIRLSISTSNQLMMCFVLPPQPQPQAANPRQNYLAVLRLADLGQGRHGKKPEGTKEGGESFQLPENEPSSLSCDLRDCTVLMCRLTALTLPGRGPSSQAYS